MFIPHLVMLTDDTRHKGNTFQINLGENPFLCIEGLVGVFLPLSGSN